MQTAKMTDAVTRLLTSNRTGKVMYTASIGHGLLGEYIGLHGPRGAVYRSLCNVNDGLHRFTERTLRGYVFAIVNGVVCTAREANPATNRVDVLIERFTAAGYQRPLGTVGAILSNLKRLEAAA